MIMYFVYGMIVNKKNYDPPIFSFSRVFHAFLSLILSMYAGPDLGAGTVGTCPGPPHFRGPHKLKPKLYSENKNEEEKDIFL